jgi:hypothetical protein
MDRQQIEQSTWKVSRFLTRSSIVVSALLGLGAIGIVSTDALAHSRHHRAGTSAQTANQTIGMTDATIARFKAALRLTPDQEKNWNPVETAMHELAQNRIERMGKMRDQKTEAVKSASSRPANPKGGVVASDYGWTALDDLRAQADERAAKVEDMRKFIDASATLYGTLDATQQRRFGAIARDYVHRELDSNSRI